MKYYIALAAAGTVWFTAIFFMIATQAEALLHAVA